MKTQEMIEQLIDAERKMEVSPNLSESILDATVGAKHKHISLWPGLMVAASVAVVVMLGVKLGTNYKTTQVVYSNLVIDDNKLENLEFYNDGAYE